ncbi:hypothetical protein ACIHCX_34275 [Streptomyces sp. NPDC052043]|uniref:hypothetical protein n=1 Tax=Streptomyces sp. NPDC052043 TaxID=3365684 RepID=UPI0037D62722
MRIKRTSNLRVLPVAAAIAAVASTGMLAAGPASAVEPPAAPQAAKKVEGEIIRDTGIYYGPSLDSQKMGSAVKGQRFTFVCWVNPTHTYPFFKLDQNGYYIPRDFVNLSSRDLPECAP